MTSAKCAMSDVGPPWSLFSPRRKLYYLADANALKLLASCARADEAVSLEELQFVVGTKNKMVSKAAGQEHEVKRARKGWQLESKIEWIQCTNRPGKPLFAVGGDVDYFIEAVKPLHDDMSFFSSTQLLKLITDKLTTSGQKRSVYKSRYYDSPTWEHVAAPPDAHERLLAAGAGLEPSSPFAQPNLNPLPAFAPLAPVPRCACLPRALIRV